jgi:hypothetical protein
LLNIEIHSVSLPHPKGIYCIAKAVQMHKGIRQSIVALDKAVAPPVAEPLDVSLYSFCHRLISFDKSAWGAITQTMPFNDHTCSESLLCLTSTRFTAVSDRWLFADQFHVHRFHPFHRIAHVKLSYLPFLRHISVTPKEFILVEKDLFTLVSGNESIAPARAEPLDRAALFRQWSYLQEARHTLYRHFHLYTTTCQKIAVGSGQYKATSALLAYDGLTFT